MTYINRICADVGTANCPCPLAETGDCLVCSRLAGKETCDCTWAGVCIYNEFIQNGRQPANRRENQGAEILQKNWYGTDLLVLVLKVPRGLALHASEPGSFVFLKGEGKEDFFNVPVSVMRADAEQGRLYLAVKIISGKTKAIAEAEGRLMLRGVYRNGLLGEGLRELAEDLKSLQKRRWLILTKGVGLAPAVNLLDWAAGRVDADLVIDSEKIGEAFVEDCLQDRRGDECGVRTAMMSLSELGRQPDETGCRTTGRQPDVRGNSGMQKLLDMHSAPAEHYDRIFILASDYYIRTLAEKLQIPAGKLVYANNFHLCCGEGICGACCHTDPQGNVHKMCKCREVMLY